MKCSSVIILLKHIASRLQSEACATSHAPRALIVGPEGLSKADTVPPHLAQLVISHITFHISSRCTFVGRRLVTFLLACSDGVVVDER